MIVALGGALTEEFLIILIMRGRSLQFHIMLV